MKSARSRQIHRIVRGCLNVSLRQKGVNWLLPHPLFFTAVVNSSAAQKKQRPLIRYAGSAAETSIGSKPIGSELNAEVYPKRHFCQAGLAMAQSWAYLPDLGKEGSTCLRGSIKVFRPSSVCQNSFICLRFDSARCSAPQAGQALLLRSWAAY